MAKEKFDFDAYQKWCEEKHLDASESGVMELYKQELAKVAETGEKDQKVAKQKEIFDAIAKYCGRKVKYNPNAYADLEGVLNGICFAMSMFNITEKVNATFDEYGLED